MPYFVDIHTHQQADYQEVISLRSYRLGNDSDPLRGGNSWWGIHPWDVDHANNELLRQLQGADLFGIGEIGLDALVGRNNMTQQRYWLERQIKIACDREMPVVLHVVREHEEAIALIKNCADQLPGIIVHGFIGSEQLAQSYLKAGAMLSFSKKSLASPRTLQALATVPLEKMFLESDAEPYDIKELYKEVALLKKCPEDVLKELLYENFEKLIL